METALYAQPNCKLCPGKGNPGAGRIKTGPRIQDSRVCPCAIAGKRLHDAKLIIENRFPERAQRMTLARFDTGGLPQNEQALTASHNFVDHYRRAAENGWTLGFYGDPAAGKTHLAVGIAQECVRRYLVRPMLFNVPQELRRERERYRDENAGPSPIAKAIATDLLILDDFGAEYHRQGAASGEVTWVYEQLYSILDERIMASRPTLFTSNLSPSDLARRLDNESGKRVLSRLQRAEVAPPLQVLAVKGANQPSSGDRGILMGQRETKEFEVVNNATGTRRRFDTADMLKLVRNYRSTRGDDAARENITVLRIARDGQAIPREQVDLDAVFKQLDRDA